MYANRQELNVHQGDVRWCKSCKDEQYDLCWIFSNDYALYLNEDGNFPPSVWNDRNIELENDFWEHESEKRKLSNEANFKCERCS